MIKRYILAFFTSIILISASHLALAQKAEITIAASMLGEPKRGPLLKAIIEEFNNSQDEIKVNPVSTPFSSFGATMFTQMGGGGGPDIIAFDQPNIYAAAEVDMLVPLDDILEGADLLPGNDSLIVAGKRYGVALDISTYALIYNPNLVKSIPKAMDALIIEAKKQTKDGIYGYAFRHTQSEEAGVWYDLTNFVYGYGGLWAKNGTPTINSPKVIEAVKAYKAIYDANIIPKGTDSATYRRMFAEGKIAMMIDNGGIPTVLRGTNPDAAIAASPAPFPTQSIGLLLAALAVNKNSDHPEAAKAFLKWFVQKDVQRKVQDFLGGSTPATRVPRSENELKAFPFVTIYDDAIPMLPEGLEAQTPEFRSIVIEEVLRVLNENGDVKAAMDRAQNRALSQL